MSSPTILIVEDEPVPRRALQAKLQAAGYQVVCAPTALDAVQAARAQRPDLMILDLNLVLGGSLNGLSDGFALLHYLRRTVPGSSFPVIIHTAENPCAVEKRARDGGVSWIIRKGQNLQGLLDAVAGILQRPPAEQVA
jgi:CheY-like chemotaxis protein